MSERTYVNSELLNWIYVTFVFITLAFTTIARTTVGIGSDRDPQAQVTHSSLGDTKVYNVKNDVTKKGARHELSVQI